MHVPFRLVDTGRAPVPDNGDVRPGRLLRLGHALMTAAFACLVMTLLVATAAASPFLPEMDA
jgi:hypothetical protein